MGTMGIIRNLSMGIWEKDLAMGGKRGGKHIDVNPYLFFYYSHRAAKSMER
jgi:hypothetical protein